MATAVAPAKPAPLSLGATERRDGTNRIELLPKAPGKPSALVDQLLEDFARSTPKPAAPPPRVTPARVPDPILALAKPANPVAPAKPANPGEDALRLQLLALEQRLNSLERRHEPREEPRQEDVMTRRVLAVLEQLTAEIKEHIAARP